MVVNELNVGPTLPSITLLNFSELHFNIILHIIILCMSFTLTWDTKDLPLKPSG